MKILITGGLGYLGCVMTESLLERGHNVTVYDNQMYGQQVMGQHFYKSNFNAVIGDIRDIDTLEKHLKTHDVIINLAALVGAPICALKKTETYDINTEPLRKIMSLLSREQMIIIPTTNSGYGIGEKDAFCTEDSPLRPLSDYGRSKVMAEEIVLSTGRGISLRLATVFGMSSRMRKDLLLNDFVYRALTDRSLVIFEGHFRRNFIHVRDVARAFVHCINNYQRMSGESFNVGCDEANLTKLELAARVKKFLPDFNYVECEYGTDPDKRDYLVSNAKIAKIGFTTEYSVEDGIVELIKGYQIYRSRGLGNV